jgi:hypothetical protein
MLVNVMAVVLRVRMRIRIRMRMHVRMPVRKKMMMHNENNDGQERLLYLTLLVGLWV